MHSFRAGVGGLHLGHRIAGALGEEANGAGVRLAHSQFIPYGGCCKKKVLVRECSVLFPPLRPSYVCHGGRYAGRKVRGWSPLARFSMFSGCVVGSSGRRAGGWVARGSPMSFGER